MHALKSLPRKSLKKKQNELLYKLKNLKERRAKHGNEHTVISLVETEFDTKQKGGHQHTLDFPLNIKAILSAFMWALANMILTVQLHFLVYLVVEALSVHLLIIVRLFMMKFLANARQLNNLHPLPHP